jgi:hypothetical protein
MPTKFIVNKWLCDNCPEMYEEEAQCFLHEREMHKQPKMHEKVGDIELLEIMCARIQEDSGNSKKLKEYQRVCKNLLEAVDQILKRVSLPARAEVKPNPPIDKTPNEDVIEIDEDDDILENEEENEVVTVASTIPENQSKMTRHADQKPKVQLRSSPVTRSVASRELKDFLQTIVGREIK